MLVVGHMFDGLQRRLQPRQPLPLALLGTSDVSHRRLPGGEHLEIVLRLGIQAPVLFSHPFELAIECIDGLVARLQGQFEATERGLFGSQFVA